MPRSARRASMSGIYHIMFRGNELRDIFIDNQDRNKFMQTFLEKIQEENCNVYAYCLMDNHVHLLIAGVHESLSRLVKRINTSYVYYFNKKYGRIGHLFHDRYKSEPVETEVHLLNAVRYIHNNPVKTGLTANASEYRWSSCQYYFSNSQEHVDAIKPGYILSFFSDDLNKAVRLFAEFSKNECQREFIDINENYGGARNTFKGEIESRKFVNDFIRKKGVKLNDLKLKAYLDVRNELIKQLKEQSDLSVRQIALLLDLNRGMVQRA